MCRISIKQIWEDTLILKEEYDKEDKRVYQNLFYEYFYDIEHYSVFSRPLPKLSWCLHDVAIFIDRHPYPVKTYFVSFFDMQTYAKELRDDPIIRKFTKLCFFIEDNIDSYNNVTDSKENANS